MDTQPQQQPAIMDERYIITLDMKEAERLVQEGKQDKAIKLYKETLKRATTQPAELQQEILDRIKAIKDSQRKKEQEPSRQEQKEKKEKEGEIEFKIYQTKFSDIIGSERQKRLIHKLIALPLMNREQFKQHSLNTFTGIILYGAPGTGKSILFKGVSGELQIKMADVKLSEILSKFVGEGEKKISQLFRQASELQPCILFIDEIDAIGMSRDDISAEGTGAEMRTIITELLKQVSEQHDRKDSTVFICGATNQPWGVDEALKRSGRLEYMLYIKPPSFTDRVGLFKYYLPSVRKTIGLGSYIKLAIATADYSPADIEKVCTQSLRNFIAKGKPGTRFGTGYIRQVLRDRDEGKSSYDSWALKCKATYIGDRHLGLGWDERTGKFGLAWKGKDGKFTKSDKELYKDMVKDIDRHMTHRLYIKAIRWMGRNI